MARSEADVVRRTVAVLHHIIRSLTTTAVIRVVAEVATGRTAAAPTARPHTSSRIRIRISRLIANRHRTSSTGKTAASTAVHLVRAALLEAVGAHTTMVLTMAGRPSTTPTSIREVAMAVMVPMVVVVVATVEAAIPEATTVGIMQDAEVMLLPHKTPMATRMVLDHMVLLVEQPMAEGVDEDASELVASIGLGLL